MSNLEKFKAERAAITKALEDMRTVGTIQYNKDDVPKSLPAAIIILESEQGKNATAKRFCDTDIAWTVYLIVNAHNVADPDTALYTLKESFRDKYLAALGRDFPNVEYYSTRSDDARPVRVAKITINKPGIGASS